MFKSGRYSGFLRPISYGIDLLCIHFFAYVFFQQPFPFFNYVVFLTLGWFVLSLRIGFYEIYRFTHFTKILSLLGKQGIVFLLIVFAYFGFYNQLNMRPRIIWEYVVTVMLCIAIVKIGIYYLLKKYRLYLGGNIRRVVILGSTRKQTNCANFLPRTQFTATNFIKPLI